MNMLLAQTLAAIILSANQPLPVNKPGFNTDTNFPHGVMSLSDETVTQRIRELLRSKAFSRGFDQVVFNVAQGDVTLQGYVQSQNDKLKLERGIRAIAGVRSLKSNLIVRNRQTSYNDYGTYTVKRFFN